MPFEITYTLECLALLMAIVFYRQIQPPSYKFILPLLILTVINEGFAGYKLYASLGWNKMPFMHIFLLVQFFLIAFIFLLAQKTADRKKLIGAVFLVAIIAVISLWKGGIQEMNKDFITLIAFSLVLLPFYYLFRFFVKEEYADLKQNSLFWFSIGLIIVQFLLLLYVNTLRIESFKDDKNRLAIFTTFNAIGNLFYYSCITYSFICHLRYRRQAGI